MPEITRLAAKDGRPVVRVHLDSAYWATLPLGLVADAGLAVGQRLTDAEVAALGQRGAVADAVSYGLRSLDFRMASSSALADRMRRKGIAEPVIAAALARLVEMGALDDLALATTRARRLREGGYAPYVARQRLERQGFAKPDVAAAVDTAYADFDADAAARALLTSRPSSAATRSRAYAFLARRGFGPDVARRVAADVVAATPTMRDLDVDELARQVRRRYPTAGGDAGARRRADAWLRRRGASAAQARAIIAALR